MNKEQGYTMKPQWLAFYSRTAISASVLALLANLPAAHAQTTDTWSLGASGLWNVAGNWSAGVVPNNGTPSGSTYNVDILDGLSTVSLNISAGINDLSLAKGNTLAIDNGETLTVNGPTITNNGAILITGGSGNNGFLSLGGNTTLSGGGTLTLSTTVSGGGNAYLEGGSGVTLTNSGNTIQGTGIIGNGGLAIVNGSGGTIDSNVSGGVLNVNNSGGITNTGLIEATNGGNLAFNTVTVTNTGGKLTASGAGSVINLANTSVTGGTLNTASGGVIESANTTTLNGVKISTGSTYTSSNNSTTDVLGTITNDGTIQVNGGAANNGYFQLTGNTTLTGGGTVNLSTTVSGGGNAVIQQSGGTLTLTNTNNVIQGTGVIGNGGLALINSSGGTIDSNVSGGVLTVNNSGGITNTGLIEASGGGNLAFNTVTVTNTGGNLTANGTGSVISLSNTSVAGGSLNTVSGGVIESANTTTLNGSTSAGAVTINGAFTGSNNATTVLLGMITNNGAIDQAGGNSNNGVLTFGSTTALASTLQGGGTVNLTTTSSGGGWAYIDQNTSGVTLTNVNNTIQGEGIIGNGGLTFVNESKGTIDASSTAGTLATELLLNGSGGITNTGLLEATNNGDLQISTTVANAGGTIESKGATATVNLDNGTITGGTLTTTGGGTFESESSTLTGVTVSKNSVFTVSNNETTLINGAITNDGTIKIFGGSGANGELSLNSNTTLTGSGTVTLTTTVSGGGAAYILQNEGSLILTNTNDTIQGNGVIGDGGLALVNSTKGIIDANVSGNALTLNGSGGITNTGLLEATNGGQLAINTSVTNTKGNITASGSGSSVTLSGATITGGTLNTSGGATMASTGTNTLSGVTVSAGSTFTASNNNTNYLVGTITNDGAIQLNGGAGANGVLSLNGNTTLSGGGTLTLSTTVSGGGNAYIDQNEGGLTLTNTNNVIQGNGIIGNGGLTVVNGADGTISSNSGTLVLNGSGGLTNQGTFAVSSGDLLHVSNATFTNFSGTTLTGGTYNVAGTLEIDELGSAGGEIVTDAANIILNGSGSSFVDSAGDNALSNLATIATAGSFSLLGGRNFTTAGNFTNNGTLSVGSGSTFDVTGSLTNFSGTTLTGGSYDLTGTLEFPGANIVTNAANIALTGSAAEIVNATTSGNGLANFAVNSTNGGFSVLGGLSFTTKGNFTNDGVLTVGTGSTFAVPTSSSLTNFSGTTLTGGTYEVLGTLEFAGANIVTNAANITLSGTGEIENSTTSGNGLANLDENAAKSSFTLLAGANFTTVGTFYNLGTLSVGSGSTFDASGGLVNFKSSDSTLSGGIYDVTGTLEFPGASIATDAAKITLTGTTAEIENSTTDGNGLAPLATITSKGGFTLASNANFTTSASGGFSTAGFVSIGTGSTFTVGGNGIFSQTAGTTTDGGALVASGGVVLSSGSLFGGGTITGNLTSTGIVTPGGTATKAGSLTDAGTYTQNAGGSLDIGIAGTSTTSFDSLNSTTAVLGGTLNISELKGFVPTVGSTFKILNFSSETGTFATVNGLTINSSEAYTVTYQGTDVLLTVVSTPAAKVASSTETHLIASRNGSEDYQLRMAAALKEFNASNADERVQANTASWRKPATATKPVEVKDLIRGHR
jgi:fibronectin-binding autotransporter adhesin